MIAAELPTRTPVLECRELVCGHGPVVVVRGLDLVLAPGEVHALVGPNGAGKTTVIETIAGVLPRRSGEVVVGGGVLRSGRPLDAIAAGVVPVFDNRALFTGLTVDENLRVAARRDTAAIGEAMALFPQLDRRRNMRAGSLSGGEQQMLAIARALVQRPLVLLIDELSMGLAPLVFGHLLDVVRRIADERHTAVLVVEQHVELVLQMADSATVLVHGEVSQRAPAADLLADMDRLRSAYLGSTKEVVR